MTVCWKPFMMWDFVLIVLQHKRLKIEYFKANLTGFDKSPYKTVRILYIVHSLRSRKIIKKSKLLNRYFTNKASRILILKLIGLSRAKEE